MGPTLPSVCSAVIVVGKATFWRGASEGFDPLSRAVADVDSTFPSKVLKDTAVVVNSFVLTLNLIKVQAAGFKD